MMFRRRKKEIELSASFGKPKQEHFDFESIEKYFRNKEHRKVFQIVSDKTLNDLDMRELFAFLDRTISRVGQQFLYNRLRTVPCHSSHTNREERLISDFLNRPGFRFSVQRQLMKLSQSDALYVCSLFQEEPVKPPRWFFIVPVLSFSALLSLILMFFNTHIFLVLLVVFILNIGVHYWNKRNLYLYLHAFPQFLKLHTVATKLFQHEELRTLDPDLDIMIKNLDKTCTSMSFFKYGARIQGDLEMFTLGILELIKIFFLIEPLLLFRVLNRLDKQRKEVEAIYSFVGAVDALYSIASLRSGLESYCVPDIKTHANRMEACDLYHPLIPDCVNNSICVAGKSVLLTGSNMSGKTTFIRTIGINVLTGLTLNTCFAKKVSLPRLQLFSAIRISDSLLNNRSYYFEEVLTIKEMIEQSSADTPCLFLLDEIFKGTNTVERISAGKAVLSLLATSGNLVFVSTHDIELADLLKEEYELYHFSEKVDSRTVDFDYKLKAGKLKNRNAIKILQINGYPEPLIEEALAISRKIDASRPFP